MIVDYNINSLIGGVSKQEDALRFSNQVEEMVNFNIASDGKVYKRNGLEFLSLTDSGLFSENMATHSYDRGDGSEKYLMTIDDRGLSVYDKTGTKKTVNQLDNIFETWGTGIDWYSNIQFLTVGDTTWVLNKNQVVSASIESETINVNKAFYWVKRSIELRYGTNGEEKSGYDYSIVITIGSDTTEYRVNATSTIEACDLLIAAMQSKPVGGTPVYDAQDPTLIIGYTGGVYVNVVRSESILMITYDGEFTISGGDSFGNQASILWRDNVDKLADLPYSMGTFASEQIGTIAITGTDSDDFNNYYVRWTGSNWEETYKPNTKETLDATSMPCKIVRQSDGTFAIGWNVVHEGSEGFETIWESRKVGDEETNYTPSFVGSKIKNMFFYKNRLGFTSEENVILSEAGEYYNFYATTMMTLLDSDPIDASVDSNTVATIRSVNSMAGALTLWADNAQFLLAGGEVLSPATTRISQTSSYQCDNTLKPIAVDNEIVFFNKLGSSLDALSYAPASLQADKSTAESIAAHVRGFVPSTVTNIKVSSENNMIFMLDGATKKDIYVYKYFVSGNEKKISAWYKWEFPVINDIIAIDVFDDSLYLYINKATNVNGLIYKVDLETKGADVITNDDNIELVDAYITLSKFGVFTNQKSRNIKEDFFLKHFVLHSNGEVYMDIINEERGKTTTIKPRYVNRPNFIGSKSKNIRIKLRSQNEYGCDIGVINISGELNPKSRNTQG